MSEFPNETEFQPANRAAGTDQAMGTAGERPAERQAGTAGERPAERQAGSEAAGPTVSEAGEAAVGETANGERDLAVVLPGMRVSYEGEGLDAADLAASWTEQLQRWLDEAIAAGLDEPNAMVLATADEAGKPHSRTVLCKGLDERGIAFYTNYTSTKSHELAGARYASVTFPWYGLHRQVHLAGEVDTVDPAETAVYWASRPRGSQLGAWASPQSGVVANRAALEAGLAATSRRFADAEAVPLPPHWGGWRLRPEYVEFWQGREDRMHDRLRYVREDGARAEVWRIERLAP